MILFGKWEITFRRLEKQKADRWSDEELELLTDLNVAATKINIIAPALPAEFDRWWSTSKYTQTIFAGSSMKQIALDAWKASRHCKSSPTNGIIT